MKKQAHSVQIRLSLMGAALGVGVGLSGCELSDSALLDLNSAWEVSASDYSGNPGSLAPQCFVERYMQPDAVITRKLDLLFLIDTSGSLVEERAAVSDGIDAFVRELPADVDYRIAVMLAHGARSSWAGRLYASGTRPKVLDSQTLSGTQLRSHLRANLTSIREDLHSDGGEAMLYSLTAGLSSEAKLAESRGLGFFREDAALAVVALSDEQDICAEYPEGVVPVPDADRREGPAKAEYCGGISPSSVHALVKEVKGDMPYLFSSIIYLDPASVPRVGENEVGYGLLELARDTGGVLIDIGSGSYELGLSQAGRLAMIKLDLLADFTLARPNIDPASIRVWVDGQVSEFLYSEATNEVHVPEPGMARSIVDLNYCLKPTGCIGLGCGGGPIGI